MEDEDMKKKIIIAAMAGMLAVVGVGATTAVAKAAGNEETAIATESGDSSTNGEGIATYNAGYVNSNFALAVNVTNDRQVYPEKRVKYTYSKVYFNWGSVSGGSVASIEIEPYGYDGVKYQHVGDLENATKRYQVKSTGEYAVTNYIHELNLPEATVAMRARQGAGVVNGKWSPDCAGTYTVLQ